jgi:hypothetical protein
MVKRTSTVYAVRNVESGKFLGENKRGKQVESDLDDQVTWTMEDRYEAVEIRDRLSCRKGLKLEVVPLRQTVQLTCQENEVR